MGQIFLTVYDKRGRPVAAKTLVDAAGNDVINPRTGQPLVVPRDYDINAAIQFGTSLKDLSRLPFSEDPAGSKSTSKYGAMYQAFSQGGRQDLQRSYNGMVGGGVDEFVPDFKDAASFNLGVVGRAAKLSPDEIVLGGGMYNLKNRIQNSKIDASGPFFNNPDDFKLIQEGIKGHDSGRFLQRMPANDQPDNTTQTAAGSLGSTMVQGAPDLAGRFGLPQHVIEAGNLLRANGYEITPRTMYLAHVLGPQAAVDLINRTGSTSSPAVPSPDAATGDQMRAWVRALRLGPAAQAGIVARLAPAPNPGRAPSDQFNTDAPDPTQALGLQ
jgi:hypothetical protein